MAHYTYAGSFPSSPSEDDTLSMNGATYIYTSLGTWRVQGSASLTIEDGGLTENNFTDADHTKLDAIETNADVTNTTNVTAAGALMDSEVTNLADVKAFDTTDYATAAQGTTADAALPKAGGTMTGDLILGDNVKLEVGSASGGDLQIYHNGSHSYVDEQGNGNLYLRGSSNVSITNDAGTECANFASAGAVDLYHNGSSKLTTTSAGVDVTGTLAATAVTGDGSALTNLPAAGETASAWCNVSGNSTIGDSYNVSSITDISTGKHYVNIDTDFSSTNYAIGSCGENNDSFISHIPSKATDKFEVWTTNAGNNSRYDTNSSSIVFGY